MLLRSTVTAMVLSLVALGQQQKISFDQPLEVVQNGKYGYIDHQGSSESAILRWSTQTKPATRN